MVEKSSTEETSAMPLRYIPITVLQIAGQSRRARRAVAFADQKFGRKPAIVARGVEADEIAHRSQVLIDAVVFARVLAR